ncbi:hypothetical protein AVEN_269275-1 [Araneus ventricosus]|uniref:Peptidase A2 domain-containing protein n=1 Tax=Araneus ventricosus TaxID=182803 RepID=A0A4Y2L8Q6_ARAVE|nr:hypothetical protein AVEN_269275-1 [Araneus ventricosus]
MAFILKSKKDYLISLASKLELEVSTSMTKVMIKDLILKSPVYNEDDVKALLDGISEERAQEPEEKEQELEEKRRAAELEENSSKYKKTKNPVEETSNLLRTCSIASEGEVKTRIIIFGKEPVTAVVDTGS